jgi:hypothetical protein
MWLAYNKINLALILSLADLLDLELLSGNEACCSHTMPPLCRSAIAAYFPQITLPLSEPAMHLLLCFIET